MEWGDPTQSYPHPGGPSHPGYSRTHLHLSSPAVVLHRGQLLGLRGKYTPLPLPQTQPKVVTLFLSYPFSPILYLPSSPAENEMAQCPLHLQPIRHLPHLGRAPALGASSTYTGMTAVTNQPAASSLTAPWLRPSSASMGTVMLSNSLSQCQVRGYPCSPLHAMTLQGYNGTPLGGCHTEPFCPHDRECAGHPQWQCARQPI